MENQKQNYSEGRNNVKLVFDVMPGDSSPTTDEPKNTAEESPKPPPIIPSAPVPVSPSEQKQETEPPPSPRSKFLGKRFYITIALLVMLGVAGYFGYRYLFSETAPDEIPPIIVAEEPVLSEAWLAKYFSVTECNELSRCGVSANPDADGLTNLEESKIGTDPLNPDSDFDGAADGDEVNVYTTDPKVADTDGDGYEDLSEVRNGYSPLIPKEKISTVEKQQIADNSTKYGLNEPTLTFMALQLFKTKFLPSSTSTPQLELSVPKDWKLEGDDLQKMLSDPHSSSTVTLTLAIDPATEQDLKAEVEKISDFSGGRGAQLNSTMLKLGLLQVYLNEYQIYQLNTSVAEYHALRVMFLKEGRLFDVSFETAENDWNKMRTIAGTVIKSIR